MATWGKIKSKGEVEDRRKDVSSFHRPKVRKSLMSMSRNGNKPIPQPGPARYPKKPK